MEALLSSKLELYSKLSIICELLLILSIDSISLEKLFKDSSFFSEEGNLSVEVNICSISVE